MLITITFNPKHCCGTITLQRPKGGKYMSTESVLMYDLKNKLNKQGWDLIKKRMWKDGHLVNDHQQYLRSRHVKKGQPCLAIHDLRWCIRSSHEEYNKHEPVQFAITNLGDNETEAPWLTKLMDDFLPKKEPANVS